MSGSGAGHASLTGGDSDLTTVPGPPGPEYSKVGSEELIRAYAVNSPPHSDTVHGA